MKKYAVFKSETGYYYHDYIDTPEALTGTEFEGMIDESRLPVILDGRGGYYHFTGKDYGFDRIIETDSEPPLTIEEMFFKNSPNFKLGWMSPDGDTYSCSYTNHTRCAIFLAARYFPKARFPESALDRAGWLKIIDSWDGTEETHGQFVYSERGHITKKQADKLFDLGLYNNPEVIKLIHSCENDW